MEVSDFFKDAEVYINTENGIKSFSVPKIAAYAKNNLQMKKIPTEWLFENLGNNCGALYEPPTIGSDTYIRCFNSDLSCPILIIKEPEGFWVGDGNHRLVKAIHIEKLKFIKAYVIKSETLEVINEKQ